MFMCVVICNIKEYENVFGELMIDYILRILVSCFICIFEINKCNLVSIFKCERGVFYIYFY